MNDRDSKLIYEGWRGMISKKWDQNHGAREQGFDDHADLERSGAIAKSFKDNVVDAYGSQIKERLNKMYPPPQMTIAKWNGPGTDGGFQVSPDGSPVDRSDRQSRKEAITNWSGFKIFSGIYDQAKQEGISIEDAIGKRWAEHIQKNPGDRLNSDFTADEREAAMKAKFAEFDKRKAAGEKISWYEDPREA